MRPISQRTRTIAELLRFLSLENSLGEIVETNFSGVTSNSTLIEPGDLFIAMPGVKSHGARFVKDSIARGAVAVLTDEVGAAYVDGLLPTVVHPEPRSISSDIASWFYDRPFSSMASFGITGTNGKTTTATLLNQLWQLQNRSTGMIGTVGIFLDGEEFPTSFTTPEGTELQAIAATMRERCLTHMVMEVSSHALALQRVRGSHFTGVAFTNLTQDHLDFHQTMQGYFDAKALLFTQEYADRAFINIDDEWGLKLYSRCEIPAESISRLNQKADWHFTSIVSLASGGYEIAIRGVGGILIEGRTRLVGGHNLDNVLLAVALGFASGLDPLAMGNDLPHLVGAPGRLEVVNVGQNFLALVDFAHTPDAVSRVLEAVREVSEGRVIAVLGCGGDRDPSKRPLMGEALVIGSDFAIFTSDNPRTEVPDAILAEMAEGYSESANLALEVNRRTAIAIAVSAAEPGDTVIILGKGHEKGQEINGVIEPFDDRLELAKAIEALT